MAQNAQKPTKGTFWNDRRSLLLTKGCVAVLLAVSVGMTAAGPWEIEALLAAKQLRLAVGAARMLLYPVSYGCAAAALVMLADLYRFLSRLQKGEVFTAKNVAALRRISWCCAVAGALALTAGAAYLPFVFLAVAAGFMALLVRVIKNAFAQAVGMKNELDYTI
jgi:cytochrome c oxidase assembly factor CtaG